MIKVEIMRIGTYWHYTFKEQYKKRYYSDRYVTETEAYKEANKLVDDNVVKKYKIKGTVKCR